MRLFAIALLSIQFVAGAAIDYSKVQDEENDIKLLANTVAAECGEAETEQSYYVCVATFIKQVMNQSNADSYNIVPFDPPFPGEPRPFPPGPEPDYPIHIVLSDPILPREPGPDEVPNDYPDRDRDEESRTGDR